MAEMTVKIWADLGGSTLKILVEIPNKPTVPIIMSSRVIELDDWLVSNRSVTMFDISPQADAIVRFGKGYYKANDDLTPNNPYIQALAMTKGKSKRAELTRLVKAIASAQTNRWQQIASWAKLLVNDADELIIGGGTALLYHKAIEETFPSTPLFWAVATEPEPIPQIPPQPTGPSGHREEWENKLLTAKPGHDALKAKEALEQYEKQLLSYQQQQADYELRLKDVQAALEKEELPLLQLHRQSQAIMEEIAQTFFEKEVTSDERSFRVTQFVDIYGVWKASANA